jgi:hypothetical protein
MNAANTWIMNRANLVSVLKELKIEDYKIPVKGEKMYIAMSGQHIEATKEGKNYRLNHFVA